MSSFDAQIEKSKQEVAEAQSKIAELSSRIDSARAKMSQGTDCLLYTSPSPRDATLSRMPSSA